MQPKQEEWNAMLAEERVLRLALKQQGINGWQDSPAETLRLTKEHQQENVLLNWAGVYKRNRAAQVEMGEADVLTLGHTHMLLEAAELLGKEQAQQN